MFDKSPCGLHMGSREPPASVLGYDVIFQIAGQRQWVAAGHLNRWSPRSGDHSGISTGYGSIVLNFLRDVIIFNSLIFKSFSFISYSISYVYNFCYFIAKRGANKNFL